MYRHTCYCLVRRDGGAWGPCVTPWRRKALIWPLLSTDGFTLALPGGINTHKDYTQDHLFLICFFKNISLEGVKERDGTEEHQPADMATSCITSSSSSLSLLHHRERQKKTTTNFQLRSCRSMCSWLYSERWLLDSLCVCACVCVCLCMRERETQWLLLASLCAILVRHCIDSSSVHYCPLNKNETILKVLAVSVCVCVCVCVCENTCALQWSH